MRFPKILLAGDPRLVGFSGAGTTAADEPPVVGWREWAALPGLGIARIHAKIDTGAKTSALHANSIEPFERAGAPYVRFDVTGEHEDAPWHEAMVVDQRQVRSSNGSVERRFVIRCELALAGRAWPVEITLTNREKMELPMLIGRQALAGRVLVDAGRSWLCGRPELRDGETGARRSARGSRRKRRRTPS
ncbi:ATP-dependent zinc protease [Rhizobiales bacterium L72]|uniref:ATP-dependent zinc protease n=2 Tax=Propylenella binzhouense TaxID=2555902 RepID=A0A964T2A6_9HYPH|nr:ATP-dependent zinc protease [Propylenella binzhouense]